MPSLSKPTLPLGTHPCPGEQCHCLLAFQLRRMGLQQWHGHEPPHIQQIELSSFGIWGFWGFLHLKLVSPIRYSHSDATLGLTAFRGTHEPSVCWEWGQSCVRLWGLMREGLPGLWQWVRVRSDALPQVSPAACTRAPCSGNEPQLLHGEGLPAAARFAASQRVLTFRHSDSRRGRFKLALLAVRACATGAAGSPPAST